MCIYGFVSTEPDRAVCVSTVFSEDTFSGSSAGTDTHTVGLPDICGLNVRDRTVVVYSTVLVSKTSVSSWRKNVQTF